MSRVKPALIGLFFAATLPFWVVDDAAAGKISIRLASPNTNTAEVKPALKRLLNTCRGILRYQDDIEWIKGSTDEASSTHVAQDHGWKQWVSFEVKVSDSPTKLPVDWHAAGQNLNFAVGPDGIDIDQPVAGRFCDVEEKTGLIKAK